MGIHCGRLSVSFSIPFSFSFSLSFLLLFTFAISYVCYVASPIHPLFLFLLYSFSWLSFSSSPSQAPTPPFYVWFRPPVAVILLP
ncbi:hypothetical protein BC940DRAFT_313688 [Gongronella butleri]|nr:hypothetical protein BC940DRAFT_313688 [Gongronella butleri]